jgi:predicted Rdx family selenoprotein
MQWLNGSYAGWFNDRHERSGHLFQGRFKAFLIEKESYFAEVLRYVVLNPVRAGIVQQPEAYRWSSYRATAGLDEAPAWLDIQEVLTAFSDDRAMAQGQYREFVSSASSDHLWDRLTNGMYLGSNEWTKRMRSIVESRPRSTDHPIKQRAVGRPQMHVVIAAVARVAGERAEVIRSERGHILRRLVAWLGWHEGLITLRSIAASLRLRSEGHISGLIRRCDQELGVNTTLLAHLDLALADLRS